MARLNDLNPTLRLVVTWVVLAVCVAVLVAVMMWS